MNTKEVKVGLILQYVSIFITACYSVLLTPFIIDTIGQSEYGLYSLIGTLIGYLSLFEFGMGATIVRYVAKYKKEDNEEKLQNFLGHAFLCLMVIAFIALFVGLILSFNLKMIFPNFTNNELKTAKVLSLFFTINCFITLLTTIYNSIITGYERYVFVRTVTLILNILKLICILLFLRKIPNAVFLTAIICFIGVFYNIANIFYCKLVLKQKILIQKFEPNVFKMIFSFTFFLFLQMVTQQLYWKIDEFLIGVYLTTELVAVYSIASLLNNFINQLTNTIMQFTLARATKIVIEDSTADTSTLFVAKTGRIVAIPYLSILIGLIFLGKQFIIVWVGKEFMEAYYIIIIILAAAAIPRIEGGIDSILKAHNKHRFLAIMYFVSGAINVFVSIIFIKKYGIIGACYGTAISLILINTIGANIYVKKSIGFKVRMFFEETFTSLIIPCIILSISACLISFIPGVTLLMVIFKIILYGIVDIVVMYLLGLKDYEKDIIKTTLRGKL